MELLCRMKIFDLSIAPLNHKYINAEHPASIISVYMPENLNCCSHRLPFLFAGYMQNLGFLSTALLNLISIS